MKLAVVAAALVAALTSAAARADVFTVAASAPLVLPTASTPNTPGSLLVRTLLADYTAIVDAARAVSAIIASGVVPAAMEMMDGPTIRAVEASIYAAGYPVDADAVLLVELDGLAAGLEEDVALLNLALNARDGEVQAPDGIRLLTRSVLDAHPAIGAKGLSARSAADPTTLPRWSARSGRSIA